MTARWKPKSEKDITDGIATGVLRESHYLEIKETARNEQIAQTIASLAIDGGELILGVAEEKSNNGSKVLVPKPLLLEGWAERIDGITRTSIDPPLQVQITPIHSVTNPERGYIVASVEPSASAPHMAGNKYYGRGEASRHPLSDSEVLRHHLHRQQLEGLGERLLDEAEAYDYLPPKDRERGHVYLIAEPLSPISSEVVQQLIDDERQLRDFVVFGQDECRGELRGYYPTPDNAMNLKRRDSSVSMVTAEANGRGKSTSTAYPHEAGLLDIELTESGGMRIFIGRGTEPAAGSGEMSVFDGLAVAYVQRLTYWVKQLSERYGYGAAWTLGIRINGIAGMLSYSKASSRMAYGGGALEREAYSRICTVNTVDVVGAPEGVVKTLVGPLLAVLGTSKEHLN